jgi:hypothetical protein
MIQKTLFLTACIVAALLANFAMPNDGANANATRAPPTCKKEGESWLTKSFLNNYTFLSFKMNHLQVAPRSWIVAVVIATPGILLSIRVVVHQQWKQHIHALAERMENVCVPT